jgi:Domain of unknown function (DUF4307)
VRTDPDSSGAAGENIPGRATAGMTRDAERYGRRARVMPSRRWLVLGAVVTVLAGLGLAWLGYRNLGDPSIDGSILSWGPGPNTSQLNVRFAVHRDHPDRTAMCTLRARSRDGAQVGTAEVAVPRSTTQDVAVTATLPIAGPAVVAEVYSCVYT